MTKEGRILDMALSKMRAEDAANYSDSEITRCLGGCVSGPKLIKIVMAWRDKQARGSVNQLELFAA